MSKRKSGTVTRIDGHGSNIQNLFSTFVGSVMLSKPYKKKELPHSVTASLTPELMETLNVVACRLGTTRATIASHILAIGISEAALGCGFVLDEDGNISDDQKNWYTKPKTMGFGFPESEEE